MPKSPIAAITTAIADSAVARAFTLGERAVTALESMAESFAEMALTAQAQRRLLDGTGHVHALDDVMTPRPVKLVTRKQGSR